jgi:hypothetical protein
VGRVLIQPASATPIEALTAGHMAGYAAYNGNGNG